MADYKNDKLLNFIKSMGTNKFTLDLSGKIEEKTAEELKLEELKKTLNKLFK